METILNIFKVQRDFWLNYRLSLSKKDISRLSMKDNFNHRIKGFLTPEYYRRGSLIERGDITFSYIFKTWNNDGGQNNYVPFWVLFSPSSVVVENPDILKNCAFTLTNRSLDLNDKEQKRLLKLILDQK